MLIKKILIIVALLAIPFYGQSAQKTVTVGTSGSKASLDTNFGNAQDNFNELYGRLDQDVKTTSNPSFASVHASGGNLAAANKQVTKGWISSASIAYTADETSVIHGGHHFICILSHTSNATGAEPGVGASWATYWRYSGKVLATVRTTAGGGSTTESPTEAAVGDALANKQNTLTNPVTQADLDDTPADGDTTHAPTANALVDGLAGKVDTSDVVEVAAHVTSMMNSTTPADARTAIGAQGVVSGVSDTEIGYLDGVTGGIQGQINSIVAGSFAFDTYPTYEDSAHAGSGIAVNGTTLAVYSSTAGKWLTASLTDSLDPTPATPTLTARAIGTDGTTITLTGSASLSVGAGGNGGFDVDCATAGTGITATYASGAPGSPLIYTLGTTVNSGDTCDLDYTQPGNGIEATTGGVDLASITSAAVTNNSTQSGITYLVDEGFEGTGLPSGWTTESGTPDYDYTTTALVGSQSLQLNAQWERAYVDFTAAATVDVSFVTQYAGGVGSTLAILEGTSSVELTINDTTGDIRVDDSGGYRGACSAGAFGTPIYIWIHRVASTANNGIVQVYVATTSEKPASPCVDVSNNTSTDNYGRFNFRLTNTGTTAIADDVKIW